MSRFARVLAFALVSLAGCAAPAHHDDSILMADFGPPQGSGGAGIDQAAVAITGGTITGITDLAVADGGTGASTATAAFNALAPTSVRGDMSYQGATDDERLAVGAAGTVLVGGTDPSYSATPLVTALVTGSADTSGVREEVNGGIITDREGDDSADAPRQALSFKASGNGTAAAPGLVVGAWGLFDSTATSLSFATASTEYYRHAAASSVRLENIETVWSSAVASGSSANLTQHSGGQVTLVDNTATTVLVIDLDAGERCGGTIIYTIIAADATDCQTISGQVVYTAANKGDVYTGLVATEVWTIYQETTALTDMTDAWTIVSGSGLVNVQLQANHDLTATSFVVNMQVIENTAQVVAIQ